MNTFLLCPQLSGYQFSHAQNMLEQSLNGGMPRQRKITQNMPHQISVSVWCNDAYEQQYFWAFWRESLYQSQYFKWGVRVDNGNIEECECKFSADPPQESDRIASKCRWSFRIYVKPKHRPRDWDQQIINIWNEGLTPELMVGIEKIPTVWLPNAVGVP